MAAYAEGFNILKHANVGKHDAGRRRRDHAAATSRALPVRPEPGRHRRGLAARQRDRLVAARPDGPGLAAEPRARRVLGPRLRLGRGPLDDRRGDRRGRSGSRLERGACSPGSARAAPTTTPTSCSRRCGSPSAATSKKRREPGSDHHVHATTANPTPWSSSGRPATWPTRRSSRPLQTLIQHGHLDVPDRRRGQVGLERWSSSRRGLATASRSTAASTRPPSPSSSSGSATSTATTTTPRPSSSCAQASATAKRPLHYLAIPPSLFGTVVRTSGQVRLRPGRPGRDREAVRPRPEVGPGAQRDPPRKRSTNRGSSGSTTTSARSRCSTS